MNNKRTLLGEGWNEHANERIPPKRRLIQAEGVEGGVRLWPSGNNQALAFHFELYFDPVPPSDRGNYFLFQ